MTHLYRSSGDFGGILQNRKSKFRVKLICIDCRADTNHNS